MPVPFAARAVVPLRGWPLVPCAARVPPTTRMPVPFAARAPGGSKQNPHTTGDTGTHSRTLGVEVNHEQPRVTFEVLQGPEPRHAPTTCVNVQQQARAVKRPIPHGSRLYQSPGPFVRPSIRGRFLSSPVCGAVDTAVGWRLVLICQCRSRCGQPDDTAAVSAIGGRFLTSPVRGAGDTAVGHAARSPKPPGAPPNGLFGKDAAPRFRLPA